MQRKDFSCGHTAGVSEKLNEMKGMRYEQKNIDHQRFAPAQRQYGGTGE